jgi:hypothetical protein
MHKLVATDSALMPLVQAIVRGATALSPDAQLRIDHPTPC